MNNKSESLRISTVQFAINATKNSHLLTEHPLGSISRLIAELLSQRLSYLGFDSKVAKLIVSKLEENTHKQLIYTSMLPMETVKKILENNYFDYCLYGEINFEQGLKIEISLIDSQEKNNLWSREINSKTYNFSVIVRRIIEEMSKILKLNTDIDKIKALEKYSTDNLKAWGWYALAFEDDLELFDKETALVKALEIAPDFLEAKLKLISLWLGKDNTKDKANSTMIEIKDSLSTDILNYFGLQMMHQGKYFESSIFYEYSLGLLSQEGQPKVFSEQEKGNINQIMLNLIKTNFELKNIDKLNMYINKYLEITSEKDLDFEQLPYFLLMTGNKDKALVMAKKAEEINPDSSKTYSSLGFIYMIENNFQEAAKAYEKSFSLSFNGSILEDWSAVLLKLNDYAQVIKIIEKYQDDLPYNSGVECNLAIAYINTGEATQAIKVLKNSVKIDKVNARTNALLGNLYFQNKNYALAQKYLLIACELEPENFHWQKSLGDLYYDSGDTIEAIKYYNRATELEPRIKIARYLCYEANNLKRENQYDQAFAKYKIAAKVEPELLSPLIEIGLLCFETKDYDNAIDYFEQALKKEPENPDIWLNLSKVYAMKSKGFFKKKWKIKSEEALNKYNSYKT